MTGHEQGRSGNGQNAAKRPADPEFLGQIFDLFDYDQSGYIEEKEGLEMAFYLDKTNMEKGAYWKMLLEKMDSDGDGKISRDEHITFHRHMSQRLAADLKSTLLDKGLPKPPEKMAEEAATSAAAAWEKKVGNLQVRFPNTSREEVELALKAMNGHAGNAVKILAKDAPAKTE